MQEERRVLQGRAERSAFTGAVLGALLCVAHIASATVLATVRGVVHDPSHRPIAGAEIAIAAVTSQYHAKLESDVAGAFEINSLPLGEYRLTVTAPGFAAQEQALLLRSGSAPVIHFELLPAGPHETVQVSGMEAPLQTVTSATETTIARQQIESYAGMDQSNSLRVVTQFVPGAYIVHDQLHVRGGHQVTWAIDGVPLPNTNIATNVGPQFDPKDMDYLEASTGGYSADYGDRTYGVFNVATRTGFERDRQGELVASYGTYNTTNDQISLGNHSERFAWYVSGNGNRTDYALAPPTQQNLHNMGDGGGGFTSLIFNKTAKDQFRFDGGFRGDFYQVPNDPDQQAAGIRDRDREQDGFAIGSWTHSVGPGTLLTLSPFFHANRAAYVGGANDPLNTTDDRISYYEGGQTVFSQVKGPSNFRAGIYAFAQQDGRSFAVTSTDNSVTPFHQSIAPHGQVDAAFVDEQWKVTPWWTMNGGLRFTYFDGSFSEHAWDPRVGTAITLPRLGWVLRGSYSRYYQAPPLDTLNGPALAFAQTQDLGFLPLHGERDEQYDVGLVIPYRGWTASFDNFRTAARNFFDHDAIGNSNLFFPLTIDRARIRGWEANVRSPELIYHSHAHLVYSNQQAEGFGAVTGGLTDFSPPESGGFYLDHDQRNSLTAGFDAALPWRTSAAFDFVYGSGFLNGDGPQHLPSYRTFDLALNKDIGEGWTVRAMGTNITNKRYQVDLSNTFGGSHVGDPRMLSAEVRYRFHF
jgi:outer membrane receptor protein involved in Fe transport